MFNKLIDFKILLKMFIFLCFLVVFLNFTYSFDANAKEAESFEVASVFQDNMIFQQNEDIRVWGTSECEGCLINARFGESYGSCVVRDGKWLIKFAPRIYSNEPVALEIYAGEGSEYISFENIRIGDVWWFIGQSNMEFSASASSSWEDFKNSLNGTENAYVYEIDRPSSGKTTAGRWRRLSQYSSASASALACFTLKNISNGVKNEVPVGALVTAYSGIELASFMPPELTDETVPFVKEKNRVYNEVVKLTENMPVRGIVWYHGEADAAIYSSYSDKLTDFIDWVRSKKEQYNRNIPVYAIELPPCFDNENDRLRQYIDYGCVRGEIGVLTALIDKYYICSTSDLWKNKEYSNNLHPDNKMQIANRVSAMILSNDYGFGGVEKIFPPQLSSYQISDDKKTVTLKFNTDVIAEHFSGFSVVENDWKLIEDVGIEQPDLKTIQLKSNHTIKIVRYNCTTDNIYGEDIFMHGISGLPVAAFNIEFENPGGTEGVVRKSFALNYKLLLCIIILCIICVILYMLKRKYLTPEDK